MTASEDDLFLGLDVGGSSTRAVVIDRTGRHRGRGVGGAANPRAQTAAEVRTHVQQALASALAGERADWVRSTVIGAAGLTSADDADAEALRRPFEEAVHAQGVGGSLLLRPDVEIAFAAGTPEPSGCVLIAGTGAIAGRIAERRLTRTVDGHGGTHGDEGSGHWLGREALRATLRALDGRALERDLADAVAGAMFEDHAKTDDELTRWQLVDMAARFTSTQTAALAPLVLERAAHHDPVAMDIVRRAAALLVETVTTLGPSSQEPTVLAGSLLTRATPLAEQVRSLLVQRGLDTLGAGDAAGAAAWSALVEADGAPPQTGWSASTHP